MSATSLLFLVVYNFAYYFLYLVLFAFLVVTPIDLIQHAVQRNRSWDILIVALCYFVTILVVIFIYATRLYINRSVLASIPKSWIPIEKGDVPRDVRQMMVDGLSRSAAIAYEARPRIPLVVPTQQLEVANEGEMQPSSSLGEPPLWQSNSKSAMPGEGTGLGIELPQFRPVWGEIEHPGWASPMCEDLPNLQYETVVLELPNLIEAKALTLAPPDPTSHAEPPALDPDAVALLQRPDFVGLREYLTHLTDLSVLAPLPTTAEFLAKYEAARFAGRPLSNEQFRSLMRLFAEILHNMHPLSPAMLAQYEDDGSSGRAPWEMPSESDIDNDAPRGTSPSSSGTARDLHVQGGNDYGSMARRENSSTDSSRRLRPGRGMRNSSANTWQFRTAPTTPKSRHTGISRASSEDSYTQTRHPYAASQTSSASLRSDGSGSVIRLAGSQDTTELPYVLTYSPSP
ncbi:hypothetical protein BT67DRAFT_257566 [Trichocladium antarcticum]|uniref:Defect at low temperature protein 1 n=1 Tax=Trichocladium antarcticum TaxID=1450529 RepID=A0AAN6UN82_9PEZI|nr:hypothetical protein BT67DRAFT_257566 [Trichocladium antarcticum]